MQNHSSIVKEITELTNTIESNYPELYSYLDENPLTLSVAQHPKVDKKAMEDYLQSLKELLEHHLQTHKNAK